MYSCSILVSHVDTIQYLKCCIEQIRKYRHPEIEQEIIIIDQSNECTYKEIMDLYGADSDIKVLRIKKVDHGYAIDMGLKEARYEYCVALDCDAFPIHRNWLYMPIKMIEKYNFCFVGTDSGMQYEPVYRDKGQFFHIMNCYQISRTAQTRNISETVGYIRPHNREMVGFIPKDESWGNAGADSGVVVQWYADQKKMGDKLILQYTSYVGISKKMGYYGIVIEDMVFHLVFGYGEDWIQDMNQTIGPEYLNIRKRMLEEGMSEVLLKELIAKSTRLNNKRRINGELISPEIDNLVENLKNS